MVTRTLNHCREHLDLLIACVFAVALIAACIGTAKGDEKERERRATAAWLMTGPGVVAAAKCECEAGTRGAFAEQFPRVIGEHRVMVAFFGTEARCCKGTLIGVASRVPVGYNPARPIVVYYPFDGHRIGVSETLPADATNADLTRAVKSAQAKVPAKPK